MEQNKYEKVDKIIDENINKVYAENKQCALNKIVKKLQVLRKHVIRLYLSGISQVVKIKRSKKIPDAY